MFFYNKTNKLIIENRYNDKYLPAIIIIIFN